MNTTTTIDIDSPYALARSIDVTQPDSTTSPGAVFLLRLASTWTEYRQTGNYPELARDVASTCVPPYTHDLWRTFVDLCGYQVADELAEDGLLGEGSMTDLATSVLTHIAYLLVDALDNDAERSDR